METVRILTIDGGGIRGLIPARVLAEVEDLAGQPVHELFDLVAGTSTGGLLALALARPGGDGGAAHTARDLVAFYEVDGPKIFHRSPWKVVTSGYGILDERYGSGALEDALDRCLGGTRLSEALVDVLIPSYDLEEREVFFFRSARAKEDPQYDHRLVDAARATSAAPTYFEPMQLPGAGGDTRTYALVDGGVYANNPAMCALVEARKLHPEATRFLVLSLGTGSQTRPIEYVDAKDWGIVQWARPILGVVFDGVEDTVEFQLATMIDGWPRSQVLRIQARLDVGKDDLDDASRTNLAALHTVADGLIQAHQGDLLAFVKRLQGR